MTSLLCFFCVGGREKYSQCITLDILYYLKYYVQDTQENLKQYVIQIIKNLMNQENDEQVFEYKETPSRIKLSNGENSYYFL